MFNIGVYPSPPDPRDLMYSKLVPIGTQPKEFSLETSLVTPVKNQIKFGSCVGQGSSGAVETHPSAKNQQMSALFVYSLCKQIDGIPNQEGTFCRCAMQVLQKYGVCRESTMPYSLLTQPTTFPTPSEQAKTEALNYRINAYAQVQTLPEIKQALLTDGGVLCAVYVYENFFSPEQGKFIPMPKGKLSGGHAMVIVGYDDDLTFKYSDGKTRMGFLRLRNSWGDSWGDKGFCYIPYDFFNGRTADTGMPYWMESWSSVDIFVPSPGASLLVLTLNSTTALVDGKEVTLDQAPTLNPTTGRTLVPLRFLSENMGYKVRWDGINKVISLSK